MATALRPIRYDDRLSVIDHLDELRTRLIICAVALAVAFGLCFWQNGRLLELLNRPIERSTPTAQNSGKGRLAGVAAAQTEQRRGLIEQRRGEVALARDARLPAAQRAAHAQIARGLERQIDALPKTVPKRRPITTGVGEPFTVTLTVCLYFALIAALPILLYQAYAFVIPAFSPAERRVALPLMLGVPFLFAGGVAFAYALVLPPAIRFLQNFNNSSFDVLIQARDYYRFEIFTMLALGLCFQVPIGMLALARVGLVTRRLLVRNWRYIVVLIAILAALLPGVDPVTTSLEMVPLLLLYGLSILLVAGVERRRNADDPELDDPG